MPMMNVRIVRMLVRQNRMIMWMRMRLSWIDAGFVIVLMVFVVDVFVIMPHFFMCVLVVVVFR